MITEQIDQTKEIPADKSGVAIERIGKFELCAYVAGAVCIIPQDIFFRCIPKEAIARGIRKGKHLKRGIASEKRQLRQAWKQLRQASDPFARD